MNENCSQADASLRDAVPRVRELGDDDCGRWDAFVAKCPEATFFHRSGWREVIERVFGHRTVFLFAEHNGRVTGVLPLAQIKSALFGHSLISLPFCVYGGVAAEDAASADALLDAATARAEALGVGHLECRNLRARRLDWASSDLYVTFRKRLEPDVEANMLAIPRKQRAMVRKGIKAGLVSSEDPDVGQFFRLYADNVHRHGTPALPKRYFSALQESFGRDVEVLTACTAQGKPVSTVLSFRFRDEILPYYAGDALSAREYAANDFKYWEVMRHACERGVRTFDYGRSKRGTGPFDFKKNWGFLPQPLAYEYRLVRAHTVPQNNPLNPKYRAFIALWKRLPLGVANRLGPMIVRSLG